MLPRPLRSSDSASCSRRLPSLLGGTVSLAPTSPAVTLPVVHIDVLCAERVTVDALGAHRSTDVFPWGNRLHVRRVDARSVAAEMIDLHPIWDWPHEVLVRPAMGSQGLTLNSECAVSVGLQGPRPRPAAAGGSLVSEREESVNNRLRVGYLRCNSRLRHRTCSTSRPQYARGAK